MGKGKNRPVVISLFDYSGVMVEPWLEAGLECWIVDTRHPAMWGAGCVSVDAHGVNRVHHDLSTPWMYRGKRENVAMVFAFPPCDHLAVSGARWFKGKGLRMLAKSVSLFATAAEFCEWMGAPYLIENPVSAISSYWRKPDFTFHPWQFTGYCDGDNYTKKTCLWTGNGFVMPKARRNPGLDQPDHRIAMAPPSPDRSTLRSMTPVGFARAVFEVNRHVLGKR
ncbi:MAG: hypothetical protein LBJ46_08190 [Planctomycetota bacterium]|jgi:hypothetical protein|nr:hypothetical protein [Planctomycetota bacterium]